MWTPTKMALAAVLVAGLAADAGEKPAVGPTVRGRIKSVSPTDKTITVDVPKKDGTKSTEEKTFKLAADVAVTLDESLNKEKQPPAGKLSDLTSGIEVAIRLTPDEKSAVAIHARGPALHAAVVSTDAGKNTLTIRTKKTDGPEEQTLALHKDAKIIMTDGLTKDEKPKGIGLGELAEGTHIQVQLSVDKKTALGVRVMGTTLIGRVSAVDVGNNTVTVSVKEDGGTVDKTFMLVKDARIEGAKLNDLQAGTTVLVTLSVFDKTHAVIVRVRND